MPPRRPTKPSAAPYGSACANCSRAKCRCIAQTPGRPCERCERLKRHCEPLRGRKDASNSTRASRSEQLEAKIDQLMTVLKPAREAASRPAVSATTSVYQPGSIEDQWRIEAILRRLVPRSPAEDESLLVEFRTGRLARMPFMCIPPEETAANFRWTRPFLWLCIVAVSSKSVDSQAELCEEVRGILAQRMIIHLERSLELLQGLLVCITWGNFQVKRRPFLTMFIQMAATIVFDLGLNKVPPLVVEDEGPRIQVHQSWVSNSRSMDEVRALVTTWYLGSVVSIYIGRIDALAWTPYMSDCLKEISTHQDYREDQALATIVKFQMAISKAKQSTWENLAGPSVSIARPTFITDVLLAETDRIMDQAGSDITQDGDWHFNYTRFAIRDFGTPHTAIIANDPTGGDIVDLHERLTCLQAFIEIALQYDASKYCHFSNGELFQLMHAIVRLYRLTALTTVGRSSSTYANIGKLAIQKLKEAGESVCSQNGSDGNIFEKLAAMLEVSMPQWADNESEPAGRDLGFDADALDLFSDDWLSGLL